ncbi:MAG TPA: Crp/Fnr family transcriptional regulator [Coleofasciculaceae cyanobacterium]
MPAQNSSLPVNRLLALLPSEAYQRIYPHLEPVTLPIYQVLYEINDPIPYVYFPQSAAISLVYTLEDGSMMEIGLIGQEGMAGFPVVLGQTTKSHRAIVQVAGTGLRMRAEHLITEFQRGEALQSLLLRYLQAFFTQVSQTAVCNRFYTTEERLARWLLLVSDCVQSDEFLLTQEFIGQMLGVRRSGVTVAAGMLSQAGLIQYTRGKITILNRDALADFSGESYGVLRDELAYLFGTPSA